MRILHPSRTWYFLFGIGATLIFLLGAAAWHSVIEANSPGCSMSEIACLFIPNKNDYGIHLISYVLMAPIMSALFLWFSTWRRQWITINLLTKNLSVLTIHNDKLEAVAGRLDIKNKVYLLDSQDCLCFCAYSFSPSIFVSRSVIDALDENELEALLLHEKYHLDNHDPLKIALGHMLNSSLVFIPVLKDLFQRCLIRKEISADQFAVQYQGNRRGILGALQKLLQLQSSPELNNSAVAGTESLAARINCLMGRMEMEKIPTSRLAMSLIAPMILLASLLLL